MLSRPSVAQSVSSANAAARSAATGKGGGGGGGGAPPRPPATAADTGEPLEGKWAQVSVCVQYNLCMTVKNDLGDPMQIQINFDSMAPCLHVYVMHVYYIYI
jgi:hypothetical protein